MLGIVFFKNKKYSSEGSKILSCVPAPCGRLHGSTSRRLPRAGAKGRALSCFAAPGAGTLRLWLRVSLPARLRKPSGLAPRATKPFGAFATLRRRRSSPPARETYASQDQRTSRACFPSRPSEPCRLTRTFASFGGGLLGHSFYHSRESGNPGDPVCLSLSFPQCVSPSIFAVAERCHSDRAAKRRRGISWRI